MQGEKPVVGASILERPEVRPPGEVVVSRGASWTPSRRQVSARSAEPARGPSGRGRPIEASASLAAARSRVGEAADLVESLGGPEHRGAVERKLRSPGSLTLAAASGSRSCVASSTRRTEGLVSRARATESRFCMPCEKAPTGVSALEARPPFEHVSARAGPRGCAYRGGVRRKRGSPTPRAAGRTCGHPLARSRAACSSSAGRATRRPPSRAPCPRWGEQPGEHPQRHRLACSVRSEQSVHLARSDRQTDRVQRGPASKGARQLGRFDGRRGREDLQLPPGDPADRHLGSRALLGQ